MTIGNAVKESFIWRCLAYIITTVYFTTLGAELVQASITALLLQVILFIGHTVFLFVRMK